MCNLFWFGLLIWSLAGTMLAKTNPKSMPGAKYYDGKKIELPLNDHASFEMFDYWIQQATSDLFKAFGDDKLKNEPKFNEKDRVFFEKCSVSAKSVMERAQCVINLVEKDGNRPTETSKPDALKQSTTHRQSPERRVVDQSSWVGGFRLARSKRRVNVVNRDRYKILNQNTIRSPLSLAAKIASNALKRFKKNNESRTWKTIMTELSILNDVIKSRNADRKNLRKRFKELAFAKLKNDKTGKRIKSQFENQRRQMLSKLSIDTEDFESIPSELEDQLAGLLADSSNQPKAELIKLFREAIKLAMALEGKNITGLGNKNVRFASPSFFSMFPDSDSENEIKVMSPSLFNLYKEETGDAVADSLSLPNLVRSFNADPEGDLGDLLNLIFQLTDMDQVLQSAKEAVYKSNETVSTARGIDGQPLYFTKKNLTDNYGEIEGKKVDTFNALYQSFSAGQLDALNMTGYTALTDPQLQMIYGTRSPYNNHAALKRLRKLIENNATSLHDALLRDIRLVAGARKFGLHRKSVSGRHRRAIHLSVFLFEPAIFASRTFSTLVTLSPFIFSPMVLSPVVLGPVALSPSIFSPIVLSPRVLAPVVLSPGAFSPIVLTPLVINPFVLCPGIFDPFVLSPFVLSPPVLSPQVVAGFTLSPMVLSPIILSPAMVSQVTLSPFMLNPVMFSPQHIFMRLLSPQFFSPLIYSRRTASAIILSPTFYS